MANNKSAENELKEMMASDGKIDWCYISEYQKLSPKFIEKFAHKVDWYYISRYQKLSPKLIEKFANKVDWYYISRYQKLSPKLIEQFANKVDWEITSKYQKLSPKLIEQFANKVDWENISKYQKLSPKLIEKYKGELNLKELVLATEFQCGDNNRAIIIQRKNPNVIVIGCSTLTKDLAVKEIKKRYYGKAKDEYIVRVQQCFRDAKANLKTLKQNNLKGLDNGK